MIWYALFVALALAALLTLLGTVALFLLTLAEDLFHAYHRWRE